MKQRPALNRNGYVLAAGDLRPEAKSKNVGRQERWKAILSRALRDAGGKAVAAQPYDKVNKHGFMDAQGGNRGGVFRG